MINKDLLIWLSEYESECEPRPSTNCENWQKHIKTKLSNLNGSANLFPGARIMVIFHFKANTIVILLNFLLFAPFISIVRIGWKGFELDRSNRARAWLKKKRMLCSTEVNHTLRPQNTNGTNSELRNGLPREDNGLYSMVRIVVVVIRDGLLEMV